MKQETKVTLSGLFPGKGQRVDDLVLMNLDLTSEKIEAELESYVSEGFAEKYSLGGQKYYMLCT